MNNSGLDFDLGWRWLLPSVCHNGLAFGLTDEQLSFLRMSAPGLSFGSYTDEAFLDLLNNGFIDKEIVTIDFACVVASRAVAATYRRHLQSQFPYVREYALLPSSNPRVVVPLSSSDHAVAALSLHRPGRLIARFGVLVARALAKFGSFTLLRSRVLLIATQTTNTIPGGAVLAAVPEYLGRQYMDFALYLGTSDDNRKTVVLPLGETSSRVILKIAETPKAKASLSNEAAALSELSGSSLSNFIPKLLGLVTTTGSLALYQEYRPRRNVLKRTLDASVVDFLAEISSLNQIEVPLTSYLDCYQDYLHGIVQGEVVQACLFLYQHLQSQAASGIAVCLHRVHGDFASWNCTWSDRGLYVFDWEASEVHGLALADAFYYAIAPAKWVQRTPNPASTLARALQMGDRVVARRVKNHGIHLEVRLYLALWLLAHKDKSGIYGQLLVLLARSWQ